MGPPFDFAFVYNFVMHPTSFRDIEGASSSCEGCSVCLDTSECISTCEEPLYDDSCELECDCDGNSCNS